MVQDLQKFVENDINNKFILVQKSLKYFLAILLSTFQYYFRMYIL